MSPHVQTPAVLMIAWCHAVELASHPLGCAEGFSMTYDPYSYIRTEGTYIGTLLYLRYLIRERLVKRPKRHTREPMLTVPSLQTLG